MSSDANSFFVGYLVGAAVTFGFIYMATDELSQHSASTWDIPASLSAYIPSSVPSCFNEAIRQPGEDTIDFHHRKIIWLEQCEDKK